MYISPKDSFSPIPPLPLAKLPPIVVISITIREQGRGSIWFFHVEHITYSEHEVINHPATSTSALRAKPSNPSSNTLTPHLRLQCLPSRVSDRTRHAYTRNSSSAIQLPSQHEAHHLRQTKSKLTNYNKDEYADSSNPSSRPPAAPPPPPPSSPARA